MTPDEILAGLRARAPRLAWGVERGEGNGLRVRAAITLEAKARGDDLEYASVCPTCKKKLAGDRLTGTMLLPVTALDEVKCSDMMFDYIVLSVMTAMAKDLAKPAE